MKKTGVLLINLGTPDSPKLSSVGPYLFEFLNDARVIDIPKLLRWILVNLFIIPIRIFSSTKEYQKLWTKKGSPLLINSMELLKILKTKMGEKYGVHLAMRYNKPSIKNTLEEMKSLQYDEIIFLPLYPQYASSSTGTAIEEIMRYISKWWMIPKLKFISEFHLDEGYIEAIVARGNEFNIEKYDHILFSYHGLPTRHIKKLKLKNCKGNQCDCNSIENNRFCYKSNCIATTKILVEKFNLKESKYSICFQSRLDKNWLTPFTDKKIIELAKNGSKNILVFSPAFVSDCLETTVEIGQGFNELFIEHGGVKLDLVPSLNTHPKWIEAVKNIILNA